MKFAVENEAIIIGGRNARVFHFAEEGACISGIEMFVSVFAHMKDFVGATNVGRDRDIVGCGGAGNKIERW